LCRVYIISGSFRAFDRRPLERERVDQIPEINQNPFGATSTHQDATSSFEISQLGGLQSTHMSLEIVGGSNSPYWHVNGNNENNGDEVQFQESLWERDSEHFNWS